MSGKNYRVYISSTAAVGGTMTEVEYQGDLTINTGATNERTSFKAGALTARGNEGWSASFEISPIAPLSTGQGYLWAHHLAGGSSYMEVKSATTGSIKHLGPVLVTVSEISHPKSGQTIWKVDLSENGTVTQATV